MESGSAFKSRMSCKLQLRKHLIRCRSICNIRLADTRKSFILTHSVDVRSHIISYQGTEIACMNSVFSFNQSITHFLSHFIYTCLYRRNQSSASHYHIDGIQFHTIFRKECSDGITTHIALIHHRFIFSDFFCRVSEVGLKKLVSVFIETYLRRSRTWIDYKYFTFHIVLTDRFPVMPGITTLLTLPR